MNSYSIQRPRKKELNAPVKRVRRNDHRIINTDVNATSFEYFCFMCNAQHLIQSETLENQEIECTECSCRIFRKARIKKPPPILAI
tara:strand:- start:908 stop:1165 length:258 start_codon:yes stop_codon:yes gene_type:complete